MKFNLQRVSRARIYAYTEYFGGSPHGSGTSDGPLPAQVCPHFPAASSGARPVLFPAVRLTEETPRTAPCAGLHHSCRLHQGGCNLIPFRSACEEEEGTALRADALSSTPPLSLPSPLSFLPHLFHSQLGEASRWRTRLRDRRIALFTRRPSPRWVASTRLSLVEFTVSVSTRRMPLPEKSTACTPDR